MLFIYNKMPDFFIFAIGSVVSLLNFAFITSALTVLPTFTLDLKF